MQNVTSYYTNSTVCRVLTVNSRYIEAGYNEITAYSEM